MPRGKKAINTIVDRELSMSRDSKDNAPQETSNYTGQSIPVYSFGPLIGNGRTCNVYVINTVDAVLPEKPLVAKVYRTGPADEPDYYMYEWLQEIKWLTQLASAHTPKLINAPCFSQVEPHGTLRVHPVIIMEHAGVSVSNMIKESAIPESTARIICQNVCRALATIHHHNLTHGDVKPGNIFWDGSKAILGDFASIVLTEGDSEEDDHACGTVSYWAPEFMYQKPRGQPIDIWALGTSYFHMVTQDHLFDVYQDTDTRYGGGLDDTGIPMIIEDTFASSVIGHNDSTDELTHFRMTMLFHKILGPPPESLLAVMSGFFDAEGRPHFARDQQTVNLKEFLSAWEYHTVLATETVIRTFLRWDPAERPTAGKARKIFAKLPGGKNNSKGKK